MSRDLEYEPDVARAYAACEAIARAHYENFPTASRLLPRPIRRHLAAFYAFARAADDVADEPGRATPAERLAFLAAWRARLHAPPDGHPVFTALAATRARLGLGTGLFERLLDAFRRDVVQPAYDDWADLLSYCRDSAEPVGRLVLAAAGDSDAEHAALSDRLCTALQLTNFWQDLSLDEPRGRFYLPRAERRLYGDERTLASALARTRRLFDETAGLAAQGPPVLRPYLAAVHAGGERVLERVRRLGTEAFRRRPALGALDRAAIVLTAAMPVALPGSSFGAAFLLLPPARREALAALHALCRSLDDDVDEAPDAVQARLACGAAEREVAALLAGSPATAAGLRLERAWRPLGNGAGECLAEGLSGLLTGLRLDAEGFVPTDDQALERYCLLVGGGPGVAALPVFDRPEARDFARALGVALQRTNVLRDVAEDARRGRCYLPLDRLEHFGVPPDALAGPVAPPGYRALARGLAGRARTAFAQARAALPPRAARDLAPALAMGRVYEHLLSRLESDPGRVFRERVGVSPLAGAWHALAAVGPARWAAPRRAERA